MALPKYYKEDIHLFVRSNTVESLVLYVLVLGIQEEGEQSGLP